MKAIIKAENLEVVSGDPEPKSKTAASKKQNIIHIGPDVDNTQCHGVALDKGTGEVIDFRCRPTFKGMLGRLNKLGKP